MPKINFASSMIVEDHLKRCLAKTTNKPFKVSNNKLLPKAQHSPFGDFPKDYMPGKKNLVTQIEPIDKHELSLAATGTGKYQSPNKLISFYSHSEKRRRTRWKINQFEQA